MVHATLSSKGQLTVPKQIRQQLGLVKGSVVSFTSSKDRSKVSIQPAPSIMDIGWSVPSNGVNLTIEQMNDAIGRAAGESDRVTRA